MTTCLRKRCPTCLGAGTVPVELTDECFNCGHPFGRHTANGNMCPDPDNAQRLSPGGSVFEFANEGRKGAKR